MAYIPPNKRNKNSAASDGWQSASGRRNNRRNKRAKEMEDEFPPLGGEAPVVAPPESSAKYVAAVLTAEPKSTEEERVEPGWVKLRRNKVTGMVERMGEPPIDEDAEEAKRRDIVLKNLVNKWQNERDEITDLLDQSSPYWGEKDLRAPLCDEDLSDSESEYSDSESDMDNWSDGSGWVSN